MNSFRYYSLLRCRSVYFSSSLKQTFSTNPKLDGPSLHDFIAQSVSSSRSQLATPHTDDIPYIPLKSFTGQGRKVFIETYGCQMNVNDTEIARGVLHDVGYEFATTSDQADVILLMTCAIREGAENKIWNRLAHLRHQKVRMLKQKKQLKIGILGCMAERLKEKIFEREPTLDLIAGPDAYRDLPKLIGDFDEEDHHSRGFKTVYKPKTGGRRFADLLDVVSNAEPNMRIRFTSPHPKDFPDEVLHLIRDRRNICNEIHLPAQSGNNEVLESMWRGYTRESYLELVEKIKSIVPGVALTSDFIAGFCGESDFAHQETLDLIRRVGYTFCFCFPYSMREKTKAHRRLQDNVPTAVKKQRANELLDEFRRCALVLKRDMIGSEQLVLVEKHSKRSELDLEGRADNGIKVIVPSVIETDCGTGIPISVGDFVKCKVFDASSQVLKAMPKHIQSSLS